ncbi:MAG: SpoIID/LytB domain-containing protein [Chloroflexi bacterium]|nr:SpoIID/LytB domain-containing protein [Chloroflexota bacterium]
MSPSLFEPTALRAQAIAARTYAYWHIKAGSIINNSTGFQVFVPRAYDTFNAQQKAIIDVAMVERHYMSVEANDLPIFSEFSADAYLQTKPYPTPGAHTYMKSVPDPISYDPAIPGIIATVQAHQRGMSQDGAGRWARGTSSYRPDAGTPWPLAWDDRRQILTHYYTDIHVRDGGNTNALQTPQYRWVPLWASRSGENGAPISLCSGGPNALSVWIQNSGVLAWTPQSSFDLGVKSGPSWTSAASASSPQGLTAVVAEGGTITETIVLYPPAGTAAGPYTVSLDMYYISPNSPDFKQWFSDREAQPRIWPTLDFQVKIVGPCRFSYLPAIQGAGVTQ